jgi:hypothetical protein
VDASGSSSTSTLLSLSSRVPRTAESQTFTLIIGERWILAALSTKKVDACTGHPYLQ